MVAVGGGDEDPTSLGLHDGLNPSQHEAVCAEVGPVRVVAGPGSGKTRVLTRRITYLVHEVGAPPWSIVAVTFTKKASEEMRGRVREILGEEGASRVTIGTFHSLCVRILRRHGSVLPGVVPGLDANFSIFDREDSKRLLSKVLEKAKVVKSEKERLTPTDFLASISRFKSKGYGPEDLPVSRSLKGLQTQEGVVSGQFVEVYDMYQRQLVANNALDFDDIILVALKMLRQEQEVLRAVGRQYRHILVDEWQDTNGPQYDLVLALTMAGLEAEMSRLEAQRAADAELDGGARHRRARATTAGASAGSPRPSIFVVGDTDQCIYRFRGADYTNVARFEDDFAGCHTVFLQENYRSTANITRAASAVIGKVKNRMGQTTKSVQGDGLPIGIMRCSDEAGEAAAVAAQVQAYLTSGRVPASEMAVMYRFNAQSRSFEEAFVRKGLPFVIIGAQRFYERREIKDCLAYLRLVANPRDDPAMRRAINTPPRGIGAKTEEGFWGLVDSARGLPQMGSVSLAECLMALLDDAELDELQQEFARSDAAGSAVGGGVSGSSEDSPTDGLFTGGWDVEEAAVPCRSRGFDVEKARLLRGALDAGEVEGPKPSQRKKLVVFARLIAKLRVVAVKEGLPELLASVLAQTAMEKHVLLDSSESFDVVNDRWQNVLELERAVTNAKFAGNAANGALEAFLNEAALMSGDDVSYGLRRQEGENGSSEVGGVAASELGMEPTKPPVIQLMTCHKSKGLEFNTVFVTGVEEGTFPPKGKTHGELDEERRLLYVGMTRAKQRLFLSWREQRTMFYRGQAGKRRERCSPSSFLADVPPDIVRSIDKTTPDHGRRGDGKHRAGVSGGRGGGSSPGRISRSQGPSGDTAARLVDERKGPRGQWFDGGRARRGAGEGGRAGIVGFDGGHPGRHMGRSHGSEGMRTASTFREARDRIEHAQYPVPVIGDGGARLSEDAGTNVDTSWVAELDGMSGGEPSAASRVHVGTQVAHPVHGAGRVVSVVDGTEAVNVVFVNEGDPFTARVTESKLRVLE